MKNTFILCAFLALSSFTVAQQSEKYPLGDYTELTDTKPHDSDEIWDKLSAPTQLSWGTTDIRYPKLSIPDVKKSNRWQTKAWKGERVNAQAVLWTKAGLEDASITVSDLKSGSSIIPSSAITTNFVRYVMTDELNKDRKGGCGHRENKAEWDSSVVADVLDIVKIRDIKARTTQPIWMNIWVPQSAKAGKYKGTLTVTGKNASPMELQIEVDVLNRTLPAPKDWAFHLDLWQNPYSVARYYQVPLWSKEHFDAMRPIMKMLANAGQRAITTSIMHKPWAGQTEDHFDSMITRIKKIDGTWVYDYAVFDKWVEFMMNEIGIDDMISCYTMIPWALSFDYYDEATNRVQFLNTKPGDAAVPGARGIKADCITDGACTESSTYFQKSSNAATGSPYMFTIDMQKEAVISEINLSTRLVNGSEAAYKYTIEGSRDGKSYKMLVDGKLNWQVGFLILNIEDPSLYRYLRLRVYGVVNVHKNNSAMWADGIYEFAAYGKPQ